jgi:putative sugar O-methyltransferase
MRLASRIKLGAASLFGFSPNDVYILKSITHRGWIVRAFRPGASQIPVAPYVYAPIRPVAEADIILSERLMAAFRHATSDAHAQTQLSPLWQDNLSHKQSILRNKLLADKPRDLAEFLATVLRSSAMYGIDSGDLYTGRNWRVHSLKLLDDLVSLAEQLDVTRTESGQATIGHAFQQDLVSLVDAIEEALGAPIGFPEVGGPYGLRIGNALLTSTTPEYLYVAWKIKQALLSSPQRSNAADFLEIGAGFGGTALFLFRLLEDQIRQYTIIDLPEMNCLQGYFLGQALGHDRIALCHEPVSQHTLVRVLPTGALEHHPNVDVVFNENSLPEIPPDVAQGYIRWIAGHVRRFFYSYNHESIVPGGEFAVCTVPELVRSVGGLTRVSRDRSWVRPGYVEEIYVPLRSNSRT